MPSRTSPPKAGPGPLLSPGTPVGQQSFVAGVPRAYRFKIDQESDVLLSAIETVGTDVTANVTVKCEGKVQTLKARNTTLKLRLVPGEYSFTVECTANNILAVEFRAGKVPAPKVGR